MFVIYFIYPLYDLKDRFNKFFGVSAGYRYAYADTAREINKDRNIQQNQGYH